MEVWAVGKLIRVKAKREHRRELARWARQFQGVRMVSSVELGFPPDLFPDIPEHLLVDSLIDGRPYHLARHVPARPSPRPRSRTVRAPVAAPTKPKGTPNAATARHRAAGSAGDAVVSPPVADRTDVGQPDGQAAVGSPAPVTSAEAATTTVHGTLSAVTTTNPDAPLRNHYPGDGCRPPHPDPGPQPAEPTTTGAADSMVVEEAPPSPEAAAAPPRAVSVADAASGAGPLSGFGQTPEPAVAEPPKTGTAEAAASPVDAAAGKPSLGSLRCDADGCGRAFTTEHARRVHVGKAHARSRGGGAG